MESSIPEPESADKVVNSEMVNKNQFANEDNNTLVGVHIHGCDALRINLWVRHPSVLVHIMDTENKTYMRKNETNRNVTYNQENSSYILPVMTKPFDVRGKRCVLPKWEETLVFNEPLSEMLKSSVMFLFELIDFIDLNNETVHYSLLKSDSGWHRIAWAFFKPVIGNHDIKNLDKKLRLQLYKPYTKFSAKNSSHCPDSFSWYSRKPRIKYPSTLYVTIRNLQSSNVNHVPQQRSCTPLQPEIGSLASMQTIISADTYSVADDDDDVCYTDTFSNPHEFVNVEWSRLPGQSCQMPNSKIITLYPDPRGCLSLRFSNSGLFLACGTTTNVFIYSAINGNLCFQFSRHHGLVYSLHWSFDDSFILTSSADCTACIWDFKRRKCAPLQVLPHPSYVYCSEFLMGYNLVVTGCFDGVLRIWSKRNTYYSWKLSDELAAHNGYVNCICALNRTEFCSGDSKGVIIFWITHSDNKWEKFRVIKLDEIRGIVINNLVRHPGGKRLLIHTRDSLLRIMDLHTCVIIQRFGGGLNDMLQCISTITPCGNLLFSTSEDGTVNVWNVNTGNHMAFYSGYLVAGCGVIDYHPYDHICALSSYSTTQHSNLILAKYARNAKNDVGLSILLDTCVPLKSEYRSPKKLPYKLEPVKTLETTLNQETKRNRDSYLPFIKNTASSIYKNESQLCHSSGSSSHSSKSVSENSSQSGLSMSRNSSNSRVGSVNSSHSSASNFSTKIAENVQLNSDASNCEKVGSDPIEHIIRHMDSVLAPYDEVTN